MLISKDDGDGLGILLNLFFEQSMKARRAGVIRLRSIPFTDNLIEFRGGQHRNIGNMYLLISKYSR